MIKKILILEDEKPLARALELKLNSNGFNAKSVSNGEEGLLFLEKEESVDFIICDLVMPKMDGFTFLKEIREKGVITPVLVLTNLSQKEDQEKIEELQPLGFFIKSDIPINKIVEYIKKSLS